MRICLNTKALEVYLLDLPCTRCFFLGVFFPRSRVVKSAVHIKNEVSEKVVHRFFVTYPPAKMAQPCTEMTRNDISRLHDHNHKGTIAAQSYEEVMQSRQDHFDILVEEIN